MPEQGLTRKQHYVPRMYLKRWQCENDKKLLVITKKGKSNSIKDVTVDDKLFYQNFCYDVPNPDGTLWTSNEVEKTLGEYESRHNKLLERILNNCEKDVPILNKGTNRIKDFLEFITLMVIRNPYNDIPFTFDGIPSSAAKLDSILHEIFRDEWDIKALQFVANSSDKKYLFNMVEQIIQHNNIPEIYFLRATSNAYFITSDNPVLCDSTWSYIPLSPQYAAFILYDTRINCRFLRNKVFQLSNEEVQHYNKLYWKLDDTFTIIGNRRKDLIDAVDIEVKE